MQARRLHNGGAGGSACGKILSQLAVGDNITLVRTARHGFHFQQNLEVSRRPPGSYPHASQLIVHLWAGDEFPWGLDASLFKSWRIAEKAVLRFNADFFNVLNMPGLVQPNSTSGILSLQNSANSPRQMQLTLRLVW